MCSSRSRNCRGIELSSRDFKTVAILVTRAKLYCINTLVCSSRSRNCWGIELSSRDFKTVAISVTQAKLYCIYLSENCCILEQIEKLSRYQLSSRDFKTVAISVTRGLKTVEHIEHIEQGLENCRGIELLSRDLKTVEHIEQGLENCRGIELSSRDLKTVAISVTQALSNVAGKVIICDNNISASGGGMA